jgi:cytochrome c oxidase subunit II
VQTFVDQQARDPDQVVEVVAYKWNWQFNYRSGPGPEAQTVASTLGTDEVIPLLVLPTGQNIRFEETSRDVVHSFWVPELLFKRDVFPGSIRNQFEVTLDREGRYVGRCAELCGTYHAMMNFEVRALSPDKFDRYMQLRTQTNPQTGEPYTAAEALSAMNCGELCTPHAVTGVPFNTNRTGGVPSGQTGAR